MVTVASLAVAGIGGGIDEIAILSMVASVITILYNMYVIWSDYRFKPAAVLESVVPQWTA